MPQKLVITFLFFILNTQETLPRNNYFETHLIIPNDIQAPPPHINRLFIFLFLVYQFFGVFVLNMALAYYERKAF